MEQEVTATDSDGHMVKRMLCSTKNVLPAYYVPGILRGARDSTMKKNGQRSLLLFELFGGERQIIKTIKISSMIGRDVFYREK